MGTSGGDKEMLLRNRKVVPIVLLVAFILITSFSYKRLDMTKYDHEKDKSPQLMLQKTAKRLQGIRMVIILLERRVKFKILVYGWKRRASLRRLIDSLRNVDYRGFNVTLEVHIDGEYHPQVMQYVKALEWPSGKKNIVKRSVKAGLETVLIIW